MKAALRMARREMNGEQAHALADAALNHPGPRIIGARTQGYDPQRLRGIPAIGYNCGGAIPGSRPDQTKGVDRYAGRGQTDDVGDRPI